jgi:hypothetical protein
MKVTKSIKTILLGIIIGTGAVLTTHADHATNFLDSLQALITDRNANSDTNSITERRALASAERTLN